MKPRATAARAPAPIGISAPSTVPAEAVRLFLAWHEHAGMPFLPDRMPWVPLGTAGPVPVLGHPSPAFAERPPVPGGCFQPFLIDADAHERLVPEVMRRMDALSGHARPCPPDPAFEADLPDEPEVARGIRRLLSRHLLEREERQILEGALRHCRTFRELPGPLAGAAWFAAGKGPLVPRTLANPEHTPFPPGLPSELRSRTVFLGNEGCVWRFAAEVLPAEELEDRILVHLPEDSLIHWHWLCAPPERSAAPAKAAHSPAANRPSQKVSAVAREEAVDGPVTLSLDERRLREFDPRALRATGLDLFQWLVFRALEEGASDLHIEPGIGTARARIRVHGELLEILETSDGNCRMVAGAAKAALGLASENFKPLDGACSVRLGTAVWNVRVNAYPVRKDYQKLVLRFLPRRSRSLSFADLHQPEPVIRRLRHAITRPQGLVLVCGPTGSGKTTTLMTCLSEINQPDINITTLEDPVEYEIQGLNQAEVDLPRRVGWQELLPAVLRQDPDVILIGEIRDRTTAETALRAALTGHLVFATLHTLSSCKAVQRLLDLGVNADMLAESLVLIQSQRLLPRLCPSCRTTRSATADRVALIGHHANTWLPESGFHPVEAVRAPRGCPACKGRGGAGRIAAMELVPVDTDLADAISRGARAHDLQQRVTAGGNATLFEAALSLAARGETTWEEALSEQANWEGFA